MRGRAWRPENDLQHPDKEAVAADHTHGNHRPNAEREHQKRKDFRPPPRPARLFGYGGSGKFGHQRLFPNALNLSILAEVSVIRCEDQCRLALFMRRDTQR